MKFTVHTLNQPHGPGICPVCGDDWSKDPRLECACTRAQPGDEAQMQAAYLKSAVARTAKLRTGRRVIRSAQDATRQSASQAARTRRTAIALHLSSQSRAGNVIPIARPPQPPSPQHAR
jgi:hypothetical protein